MMRYVNDIDLLISSKTSTLPFTAQLCSQSGFSHRGKMATTVHAHAQPRVRLDSLKMTPHQRLKVKV